MPTDSIKNTDVDVTKISMNKSIRVAVTGAAGNIGYAMLWRIASGDCFGAAQPINLQLLEIPPGMQRLEGVIMELNDSAFPLVHSIIGTDDPNVAFQLSLIHI